MCIAHCRDDFFGVILPHICCATDWEVPKSPQVSRKNLTIRNYEKFRNV